MAVKPDSDRPTHRLGAERAMAPWKFFAGCTAFVAMGARMLVDGTPGGRLHSRREVVVYGWIGCAFFGLGGLFVLTPWLAAGRPKDLADVSPLRRGRPARPGNRRGDR